MAWDQTGDDRAPPGTAERHEGGVEERDGVDVPNLDGAQERVEPENQRGQAGHDLGEDNHAAAVETIGNHAADEGEAEDGHGARYAGESDMQRGAGEQEDLPGGRELLELASDTGDHLGHEQQSEVAVAQGRESAP